MAIDVAARAPAGLPDHRRPVGLVGAVSRVGPALVGVGVLLVTWTLLAVTVLADVRSVPTPWQVAEQVMADFQFYGPHTRATAHAAALGFLWGNLAALAVAVLFLVVPAAERLGFRLALAIYCMPLVAVGPILQIVLEGDGTRIALAAQAVFFTTLIGLALGLRSADPASLEVIRTLGGTTRHELTKVRLWAALPATFSALKIAAPAALLGAIIGEYLGGRRGLGVALVYSQQSYFVARTWGLALVITALAALGYAAIAGLGRAVTSWSAPGTLTTGAAPPARRGGPVARAASSLLFGAASVLVILGVWAGLIAVFDLDPYFAKTPVAVWDHLVDDAEAAANRRLLLDNLGTTLTSGALGYLVGTVGATTLAVVVASNRLIDKTVLPIAIAARSVPLVAMTPLVALFAGRGLLCVLIVAGMVAFFPTLVNVVDGMRAAPEPAADLVRGLGGSGLTVLLRVRLPYALPAVFASARIAAPLAMLGAILSEWLVTGDGIGDLMLRSIATSQYSTLWAAVAVVTAAAGVIYSAAAGAESLALRHFQPTTGR